MHDNPRSFRRGGHIGGVHGVTFDPIESLNKQVGELPSPGADAARGCASHVARTREQFRCLCHRSRQ